MQESSSLSEEQREAAVALFEMGWGAKAAATRLGVRSKPVIRMACPVESSRRYGDSDQINPPEVPSETV